MNERTIRKIAMAGLAVVVAVVPAFAANLKGRVTVDGSSTVYPITEAVAEEFQIKNSDVRVTVGISGTGGGFKKFTRGETDISDASRPIKSSEDAAAVKNKIDYIELPVAFDGLAVLVHPSNTWAESITVKELKKLWEPAAQGKIMRWSDIRAGWPSDEIHLFGPGTDSGTFDYFTEVICGKSQSSRGDFTSSEDDNVLVQGIASDPLALGYFGLAYYEHNKDRLKLVAVDDQDSSNGAGPILPSTETVEGGTYQPLARPIFIYVSAKAADRPEVDEFVRFYLDNAPELVKEVGYISLPSQVYQLAMDRFGSRKTGTVFAKKPKPGTTLADLLK
ncbi:MAG: PstS family phosphate ABC transporter substrate-binding protein [Candidatus Omnitrophota bacterium]|nr:PstS family phosphate ABC transporter substrate-binding protein [Candidatus Omnitrophota bacterium]